MKLRHELLRRTHDDGSLELYDPLTEQITWIPASELDQWPVKHPVLAEGALAERLRAAWWARRTAAAPPPPDPDTAEDGPWSLAEQLPEGAVASRWRDPETWRRLAEDRRGGNGMLPLGGLVSPGVADALAAAHDQLPFARLDRHITAASRCLLATTDLEPTQCVDAAAARYPPQSPPGSTCSSGRSGGPCSARCLASTCFLGFSPTPGALSRVTTSTPTSTVAGTWPPSRSGWSVAGRRRTAARSPSSMFRSRRLRSEIAGFPTSETRWWWCAGLAAGTTSSHPGAVAGA